VNAETSKRPTTADRYDERDRSVRLAPGGPHMAVRGDKETVIQWVGHTD
jgi:hypothetical protein